MGPRGGGAMPAKHIQCHMLFLIALCDAKCIQHPSDPVPQQISSLEQAGYCSDALRLAAVASLNSMDHQA
jgi:hypothetical protein